MPDFLKKWFHSLSKDQLEKLSEWTDVHDWDHQMIEIIEQRIADRNPSIFDPEEAESIHDEA